MKGEINMFSLVMDENELNFFENLLKEICQNNIKINIIFDNVQHVFADIRGVSNFRYCTDYYHYIKNANNTLFYSKDYYGYNENVCDIVNNYIRSYNYYLRFRKCKICLLTESKDNDTKYKCIRYSFYKENNTDEENEGINIKEYFSYNINVSEFKHINVCKDSEQIRRNNNELILNDINTFNSFDISNQIMMTAVVELRKLMDLIKLLNEILFKLDNEVAKQIHEEFELNSSLSPAQLKEYEKVVSQLPDNLHIYWSGTNAHHHYTLKSVIPMEKDGIEEYHQVFKTLSPVKDIQEMYSCITLDALYYIMLNRYYIPQCSKLISSDNNIIMKIKPDKIIFIRNNLTEADKYVPESYFKCEIDISCIPLRELKYVVDVIVDKYKKLAK